MFKVCGLQCCGVENRRENLGPGSGTRGSSWSCCHGEEANISRTEYILTVFMPHHWQNVKQ